MSTFNTLKRFLLSILMLMMLFATFSQNKIHLTGKIVDFQSNRLIEFANIGIAGKNIGTISNEDGEFELFLPMSLIGSELVISYIGYKPYKANISEADNRLLLIKLEPENIEIEEIVVSALTPEQLLKQVIKNIPKNYTTKPYMTTGFYREIVNENSKPIEIIEALLEFYKTTYLPNSQPDQARVLKGRKVVSKDPEVFKEIEMSGGPLGGIGFDIIKYQPGFLDPKSFKYYEFKYNSSTKYNGKTVYVIDFDQKEGIKKALYNGKLFVDIESLALVSAIYQYSPRGIKYLRPGIIGRSMMKMMGIELEFRKIYLKVNYEECMDKWYLKNVLVEAQVGIEQAKKGKTSMIDYTQSLLITDRNMQNVSSIPKDEQISRKSKIADETGEYDEEFWKNFNTIKAGSELRWAAEEIEKGNLE